MRQLWYLFASYVNESDCRSRAAIQPPIDYYQSIPCIVRDDKAICEEIIEVQKLVSSIVLYRFTLFYLISSMGL